MATHSAAHVYLKVKNLGNLLNDDWGKVTDAQYFPVVVNASLDAQDRFVYESSMTVRTTVLTSTQVCGKHV